MHLVNRYAIILLTVGLVLWVEGLFTIEWSYPYCLSQSDGPAYAAQGMPLPYWMWNGVASLEHSFMPLAYILNIIVLSLLMFPAVRWLLNRVVSNQSKWLRSVIGVTGCLLLLSHVALMGLLVSTGWYRPEISLGLEGYYRYTDFRPVRFGLAHSNAPVCRPSRFWFPDGWRHD
ncbi:MAG: hypothetical protein QOD32_506 [Pyrinomonadaceae bacterium]|jgi:hypothetical protein|nr:hypothetical protein [Pyrinomonadaceae bacterium]